MSYNTIYGIIHYEPLLEKLNCPPITGELPLTIGSASLNELLRDIKNDIES